MSKKRNTFCTVSQWLEQEDDGLYEAIDSLCAMHNLKPRGDAGITFLYPEDKKYRDKIVNAQFGDSDEQLAGEKIVKSLVLYINLPDPGAFIQFAKDIPNALGNRVKLVKTAGNSVELEGGVTITPDKGFIARGDRKNMCVWRISKGEMPLAGEKHTFKQEKGMKKKMGGGRQPILDRAKFAASIEEKYRQAFKTGSLHHCDPYPEAILSLLTWLKYHGEDGKDVMRSILACTGPNWMVEFYNIFQPYRRSGHLLEDGLFTQWQKETMGYCFIDKPALALLDFYKNLDCEAKDDFSSKESRKALRAKINQVRSGLFGNVSKSQLATNMRASYKSLTVDTKFPNRLASYYADENNKLMEEEVRFIVGNAFSDMLATGLSADEYLGAHEEVCKILQLRLDFNGGAACCTIFDPTKQDASVFWYSGPYALLRSSQFFFTGAAQDDESRAILTDIPDPDQVTVVDTVGHEWAFWSARASDYSSKSSAGVCDAAAKALEIAQREKH